MCNDLMAWCLKWLTTPSHRTTSVTTPVHTLPPAFRRARLQAGLQGVGPHLTALPGDARAAGHGLRAEDLQARHVQREVLRGGAAPVARLGRAAPAEAVLPAVQGHLRQETRC